MSHVAIASNMCPVCGDIHEYNTAILLHKQLKDIETDANGKVVTGCGMCENHDKLDKNGFIALIVINDPSSNRVQLEDSWDKRTGDVIHIKRDAAKEIFGPDFPVELKLLFVDEELSEQLKQQHVQCETEH